MGGELVHVIIVESKITGYVSWNICGEYIEVMNGRQWWCIQLSVKEWTLRRELMLDLSEGSELFVVKKIS